MADEKKLLIGLWDCPYCGSKGINGLKKKCPNCAHTQDAGTKFYLGVEKEYLEEDKAEDYGKGADWTCAYCGGLNRYSAEFCSDCGAPREENTGSYFDNRAEEEKKAAAEKAEKRKEQIEQAKAARKKSLRIFAAVAAALLLLIILISIPKIKNATVTELRWERSCSVEVCKNVTESAWSLPPDGTLVSSQPALHHYEQILDHYEDVQQTRSREVLSGYDESVTYVDNGDGTFSEQTVQTPVYTTEYYTETVSEPVYRQEPVFATQYTYTVDRWFYDRTETASGDSAPYWPEIELSEGERIGDQNERYILVAETKNGRSYTLWLQEQLWENCSVGDSIKLSISGSSAEIVH